MASRNPSGNPLAVPLNDGEYALQFLKDQDQADIRSTFTVTNQFATLAGGLVAKPGPGTGMTNVTGYDVYVARVLGGVAANQPAADKKRNRVVNQEL